MTAETRSAPQSLQSRIEPLLRRLFHLYWRFARGMTLGVRAVVLDGENRIFLVRHSYVAGWPLPRGGGEGLRSVRPFWRRSTASWWGGGASSRSRRRCCMAYSSTAMYHGATTS